MIITSTPGWTKRLRASWIDNLSELHQHFFRGAGLTRKRGLSIFVSYELHKGKKHCV
jgi:hypothetical protein